MDEMHIKLSEELSRLRTLLSAYKIDPNAGLPLEFYHFISEWIPLVNIDLFILDQNKGVLLSWRDDPCCGEGWHVPGGCVRLREKLCDRIQRTAMEEIGTEVLYKEKPIAIGEIIAPEHRAELRYQNTRAHNIALLYRCALPEGFHISNEGRDSTTPGYLQWFDVLPDDFLALQEYYRPIMNTFLKG